MEILGYLLVGVIVSFGSMRWWFARQARKAEGQPLPEGLEEGLAATIRSRGKALLYFYSPHCGPCRAMTPVIDRLAGVRDNVFKFDVSREMAVARQFSVMATPTVVLATPEGIGKVILGPASEAQLMGLLD